MAIDDTETIVVEVDTDLLEQVAKIIHPMDLPPEILVEQFIRWCVTPETRDTAMTWLLNCKTEPAI